MAGADSAAPRTPAGFLDDSGAVCRARERECSGKAVQPLDQDNGRTAAERLDGWFDPQRDTVPDVQ